MTTLYGGTNQYGPAPTSLTGFAEYQPPVTYYQPVQQNYASQTNNNTTVKQNAPLMVPEFNPMALPTMAAPQQSRLPGLTGNAQTFDNPSIMPISNLVNAIGPEGGPAGGAAPAVSAPTQAGASPAEIAAANEAAAAAPDDRVPQGEAQDPARAVQPLNQVMDQVWAQPPRERGIASYPQPSPAEVPAHPYSQLGPNELAQIYADANEQMASIPRGGLTKMQMLGAAFNPEMRRRAFAMADAESKGRAAMHQKLIDEKIEAKKAEMAKEMNAKEETELISKFIDAPPEEREALMRAQPFLNNYADIPQTMTGALAMKAKVAGHMKDIAGAMQEIYKLTHAKESAIDEATSKHIDTLSKTLNLGKSAATYQDDIAATKANANKAQVESRIATETEQDKINASHVESQLQQWELANQPIKYMAGQQDLVAKYNDIRKGIQEGQMSAAKGMMDMGYLMMKASSEAGMTGDTASAEALKKASMSLFTLGEPIPEPPVGAKFDQKKQSWVDAKGKKIDYKQPLLGAAKVGNAAAAGAMAAQGGMAEPPSPMTIQGGVSAEHVPNKLLPGQGMQLIPPPPPTPVPGGLPMAGMPPQAMIQGGIGGGAAGHQATGGGFVPPPPVTMPSPNLMQQYPQLMGQNAQLDAAPPAVPASMGAPQMPLQGGVMAQGPVQAFNRAMMPPQAPPQQQAVPPAAAAPPQPGFFEGIGNALQSGKGGPPMLGPNNPPQGLQRALLGGVAFGQAYGKAVGGGIGNAINQAVAPYRMPDPETVRKEYIQRGSARATKMKDMVVTPWVTPESRGLKNGAVLTDPELKSYFYHKGGDSFTAEALMVWAGWVPPSQGFSQNAPQPMTHDYERFKRFDTGGPPARPQPGDDAPYTQFDPKLLPKGNPGHYDPSRHQGQPVKHRPASLGTELYQGNRHQGKSNPMRRD
jgi:hypothetical protein